MAATEAAPTEGTRIMSTSHEITDSAERAKLRMVAAIGVIVIAAGFGLGVVMHTTSSAADDQPMAEQAEPTSPGTEAETPVDPAAPADNAEEPAVPADDAEEPAEEPAEPGDDPEEPSEPAIDPELLPDGLTTPWPIPDPTPIPPIDGLHNPELEPTPPSPCCIDPDLGLLAPDAIDPKLIGLLLPAVQA